MDYLIAIVLGIIEGITEFLPISSTGHLLIAEHWLGQKSDTFNIVIQAGAILAITVIYWPRLMALLLGWREKANRLYLGMIVLAFVITAVLGLIAKKLGFALPETLTPVACAMLIGGLWILVAEWFASRQVDNTQVSWVGAVVVGFAQMLAAIFPGTSRSAASIFALMFAGTSNRAAATEFAFLVGIPTMYAASAVELYDQVRLGPSSENWGALALGFVVAAAVAFVCVKWLLGYIQSHRFTAFAIYRIVFGAALLIASSLGLMH